MNIPLIQFNNGGSILGLNQFIIYKISLRQGTSEVSYTLSIIIISRNNRVDNIMS